MAWIYLITAVLLEVSGTTSMKLSRGFTVLEPTVAIFVFSSLSIVFLTLAIQRIEISVAYAVWSGLGTAVVATIGILWFREVITVWKVLSLLLIIVGVVGLNLGGETVHQG